MVRPPSLALVALAAVACRSTPDDAPLAPEVGPTPVDRHILVAGEPFEVGAPVVLWTDEDGYSAYETGYRFGAPPPGSDAPGSEELRYRPGRVDPSDGGRRVVEPESRSLHDVRRAVDLFVLHYDVCGTSRRCFEILHDRRGLSVHFLIDVDGTIYQTMDVRDTAWHARQVNWRSVGVEIASIGSYAVDDPEGERVLERWYDEDEEGTRITFPSWMGETGIRTVGFVPRPARPDPVRGPIQGGLRVQYDFTREQYDALVKLTATLVRALPRIRPDAPRDERGRVRDRVLTPEQEAAFSGIVGHYHVADYKQDPGPAFDWERFLARVRARLAAGS